MHEKVQPGVERLVAAGMSVGRRRTAGWRHGPSALRISQDECRAYSKFWAASARLLRQLPPPAQRQDQHRVAAEVVQEAARSHARAISCAGMAKTSTTS